VHHNVSTPCHHDTSTLQCRHNQQISEETGEHFNVTNNGQKKVEHMQKQWKISKETGEHANTITNRPSVSDSCHVGPSEAPF
jgi:hypothetical protein